MRLWRWPVAIISACAIFAAQTHAQGSNRYALIIANKAYSSKVGLLLNTHKDAALIKRALIVVGFAQQNIEVVYDASRREMLAAVERHARRLADAGSEAVGFFYYSGHGAAQPKTNRNFLIPVNVTDAHSPQIWYEAVGLDRVRELLESYASKAAHIVVFDACRNELQSGQRGVKGFAAMQEWGGMLIAYSTAPGQTASDGNPNAPAGPYATVLAEELLAAQSVSASELFAHVRMKMRRRPDGQSPWFLHGLDTEVTFTANGQAQQTVSATSAPATQQPQAPLSDAVQAWQIVQHTKSEAVLEEFIRHFGDSLYGSFARAQLEELRKKRTAIGFSNEVQPVPSQNQCDGVQLSLTSGRSKCIKPGSGVSFRDCEKCPEMVVVPAGGFMMGSPENEKGRYDEEGPQHSITIPKPIAVGKFEITFEQWDACVKDGFCKHKPSDDGLGRGKRPVVNVSWQQIEKDYLPWLKRNTGRSYRFLSEAEWEYVARAGGKRRYFFGDNEAGLESFAWYQANAASRAHPVGEKAPNDWGLHDVHGNVWELVKDCWSPDYSRKSQHEKESGSARTDGDCRHIARRGGSFFDNSSEVRSAIRGKSVFNELTGNVGFRVARELER